MLTRVAEEQEHEEEERKKPKHDEFPLELNADGQPTSHEHYILMKFKVRVRRLASFDH
jgi:hypothetical protein